MFRIGDKVVYGMHGVCVIVDKEERIIDRKTVVYLALEPVGQDGSRYLVPTHNAVAMGKLKKMMSPEELVQLLDSDIVRQNGWIRDENIRKQTYRELIRSGDRVRLMQMVCSIYQHKAEQCAAGKKCHLCDENFLRDAEKLLASEISAVMELSLEEARQLIRSRLKKSA